ncbi:MAG: hypothetical protein IKC95_00300 [Oscillospiraceae bacterium]|nr:hypothetical protein [Oscillospiraceae bacterium]
MNPDRFSQAAFRQSCGKSLENTNGYSLRDFTWLDEKQLCENCCAPHSKDFCFGFFADDESLLTQAEEDKEKYKRKDCCGAVGVRLPTA